MKFTVNRDTGKGKRGGAKKKEDSIDCVESLGEAGKGDADTRMTVGEKRRKGWDNIWGAVKEANKK